MAETRDVPGAVSRHYSGGDLAQRIFDGLRTAGKDPDRLRPEDLAAVDQLHVGGRGATKELARLAGIQPGWQVLDIGGGLGGAARLLASEMRCQVTVLDLTRELVEVGAMLTERMDLAGLVHFRHGTGLELPFTAEKFDAVWTQHCTMNIQDKPRLYAEMHRVLRPRGRLAMHEVLAGSVQPVQFPTPWSADGATSFLLTSAELRGMIERAGFRELVWNDVTAEALAWFRRVGSPQQAAGRLPVLGPHLVLGDVAAPATQGQVRNLEEGRIEVVQAVFERH